MQTGKQSCVVCGRGADLGVREVGCIGCRKSVRSGTYMKKQDKQELKESRKATFGWHAFTADANFRVYEKQLDTLSTSKVKKDTSGDDSFDAFQYGNLGVGAVSKEGLNRMSNYVEERQAKRGEFSRRRMNIDTGTDYINERNEHFNKKIKRSFDKYTNEIRQNLERGTAL